MEERDLDIERMEFRLGPDMDIISEKKFEKKIITGKKLERRMEEKGRREGKGKKGREY